MPRTRWGAVIFVLFAASGAASAQDAAQRDKDVVFARKILMDAIESNMTEITRMLESKAPLDVADASFHADMISSMLLSFPHLFPDSTNQWKAGAERDPATDTYASPDLWRRYGEFYARTAEASKTAFTASRAADASAFRSALAALRTACDGCHADFRKED